MAEAQEGPVQKGFEGKLGVFADVSDEGKVYHILICGGNKGSNCSQRSIKTNPIYCTERAGIFQVLLPR